MRPFSSKTISTGSYTIGSFAKRSTMKSGLIWMLFRDSSGERGGWSAYCLPQPTRKIKAVTQYSIRFIIVADDAPGHPSDCGADSPYLPPRRPVRPDAGAVAGGQ